MKNYRNQPQYKNGKFMIYWVKCHKLMFTKDSCEKEGFISSWYIMTSWSIFKRGI